MTSQADIPLQAADGHRWQLIRVAPEAPHAALLWLPALGVAARHYLPFAQELAVRGIAVHLHEWRGNGSSSLRAGRETDWGYREILEADLPGSHAALPAGMPHYIGGHSLGGQLASVFAALHPVDFRQLWLVASGSPYWRGFPPPRRWALPAFYRFAMWWATWRGCFNGRRFGFGGVEARGLIHDWARVGLSNRYAAAGMPVDLEAALGELVIARHSVLLGDDWLAPRESLMALISRLAPAQSKTITLDARKLGTRADHFAWMQQPRAVIDSLLQ